MKKEKTITVQAIEAEWLRQRSVWLAVLRLDEWHPVVSGNKWFKLQHYLEDAVSKEYSTIATFGGAYSNHIVATAFACREKGLQSTGIIRGEKPAVLSHTLQEAKEYGMLLQFVSREAYRNKEAIKGMCEDVYWINEGGYGNLGAKGAGDIIEPVEAFAGYTHIACAAGTGTTLAGLIKGVLPHQKVLGFSALKNNTRLEEEVKQLLSDEEKQKRFEIMHEYHFGGYAKHTPALLSYVNRVWEEHNLPLDFVYTAKAFYGLQDVICRGEIIPPESRVLFIHTGGLQGNLSLGKRDDGLFFSLNL